MCARVHLLVVLAVVAQAPAPARADGSLPVNRKRDLILIGVGGGAYLAAELLKDDLTPARCRWCDDNALDRAARDAFRWDAVNRAATASDVTGYALVPGVALGLSALVATHDGRSDDFVDNSIVIVQAATFALDLNQLVKYTVMRARPAQLAAPRDPEVVGHDVNLSFYSGHTTLAFSLATAGGMVASIRGYRWSGVVWGAGLTAAAATGYFRMAADKHYLSDVLVGALIGAGFGVAIPLLHRRCPALRVVATPVGEGALLGIGGAF